MFSNQRKSDPLPRIPDRALDNIIKTQTVGQ